MPNKKRCTFCKTYVDADSVFANNGIQSWCSKKCLDDSYAKANSKSISKNTTPKENKELVKKRDKHKCRLCEAKYPLHVHHIRYRSEFGRDEIDHSENNLITLCDSCHTLVHSDKKKYQEMLLSMVSQQK